MHDTNLVLGGKDFTSRLIVGTGKYSSNEIMRQAHEESGAEIVTIAVRRVSLPGKGDSILDFIDTKRFTLLPNTAGCYTADEALRVARLGRELTGSDLVKLEVIGDQKYLLPDMEGTLEAARKLVKENFAVLPYITDDPILALRLQEIGTVTVMPLGSPIGSGQGIETASQIRLIVESARIPVVVDAGIGTASDAAQAMEMGADAVLVNSAVAAAGQPALMAEAISLGVEAGRKAFLAGRMQRRLEAAPSSPSEGISRRS